MIKEVEITKGKQVPEEYKMNLLVLLEKLNLFRQLFNKPMKCTSGFRTIQEHLNVYYKKGIFDDEKIPMKSKHLFCQAADFYDPKGEIKKFAKKDHYAILKKCGLYMESEKATANWIHLQSVPPKSGKWEFEP